MTFPWENSPAGPAAALATGISSAIPTIATTRLRLRPPRIGDFQGYASIVTTERGRHMGGPMTREEAWLDFNHLAAGWLLRGHGLWSVERLSGEALVGFVLVNHEFGDAEPELGFLLLDGEEGKGYATEAAQAARHFAFGILGWRSLVSYIDAANARSVALAERLGAALDADASIDDLLVYRHIRAEGAK
ncbi:MAG: N-acetyltransferase [Cereibacter sphaeroides]|uniref:N-acetyltransferase n=1 Tax=Cereibacter sphaeroides TaxID=1063 RepID=A0A2W5S852_CERSP|nr:MAG: N-acetyltransferase [Cereibacter sphaeroides]